MYFKHFIYIIGVVWALTACTTSSTPSAVQPGNRYATGFAIEQSDSAVVVRVYSPWNKGHVMGEYTITQPYQRLACNSCTHVGFLNELGAVNRLVAVSDKKLVYTPLSDSVRDLGNSMSLDKERLLLSHADAVLLSTYAQGDANQKLSTFDAQLSTIYINEWNETTPLARAEWIRVVGALVGKLAEADSIFDAVCTQYDSIHQSIISHVSGASIAASAAHPSILSGQDFRGTWYVPAGGTFMGQLFSDAGYTYRYADDRRETSIPLTTEQVLREFMDADVWVGVQVKTLDELRLIDEKHTWLHAFQSGRVYHFMKRTTDTGANDFWETGVVHPERILNDLRLIQTDEAQDSLYFTERLQ